MLASIFFLFVVSGAPVIYFNASVHTVDDSLPSASAFCVSDQLFKAVGTLADVKLACDSAQVVDLQGATVVPGFIDAHAHLMIEGFKLLRPQLDNCTSVQEVVKVLQEYVSRVPLAPGEWLQGFGWDQNLWVNQTFPTKEDLDGAFPSTPVYLIRIDGHASWTNSAGIRACPPLPSADPEGGRIVRDAQGRPTGVFTDSAMELIADSIPPPTHTASLSALSLVLAACRANGLTAIHNLGIGLSDAALFKESIDAGNMTLRQYAMWLATTVASLGDAVPLSTPPIEDYHGFLTVKAVKMFLDGALGSWGAALLQPYTDRPDQQGELRMTAADFEANCSAWLGQGYQLATHAIGDRANRLVIDTYRKLCDARQATDLRLRIEHFQIVNETDFARIHYESSATDSCILASMQPTHATSDMGFAEQRLGPERIKGAYAWQSVLQGSHPRLAFGSDFPTVGTIPPLLGIYAAVTRQDLDGNPPGGWYPLQRVSVQQALKGYTRDAAFAGFQDNKLGSITTGKLADFVILDRDLFTINASDIWKTVVLKTVVGGQEVFTNDCWSNYEGEPCSLQLTFGDVRRFMRRGDGCPH